MAAITWQNISGNDYLGAAKTLALAQESANTSLSNINDIFKRRATQDAANWDQAKTNNTQAFLNEVAKYRTPEEFQAAQQAGVLDQLRQSYGAQVDQNAVRTAQDSRLATLQGRAEQDLKYNQIQRTEEQRPLTNRLAAMIAAGDTTNANLVLAAHPELDAAAKLSTDSRAFARNLIKEGQADTTFELSKTKAAQDLLKSPLELEHLRRQNSLLGAQAANLAAETAVKRQTSGINNALLGYQQHYTQAQDTYKKGALQLAINSNVPINKTTGEPDFTGLSAEQGQAFKDKLLGTLGKPPSSSAYMADFEKRLTTAGVPVDKQLAARELFGKAFDSGTVSSPADNAVLKSKSEQLDARLKSIRENNPFAIENPEKLLKEQKAVIDHVNTSIKDGDYWTKSGIKEDISKLMTEGLTFKRKDGKEVTVPIPPAMMQAALATGMETDTALFNKTVPITKNILEEMLLKPETIKLLEQAQEFNVDPTGVRQRKAFVDELRNQPGIQNSPTSWLDNLDSSITAAQKKSPVISNSASVVPAIPAPVGTAATAAQPIPVAVTIPKASQVVDTQIKAVGSIGGPVNKAHVAALSNIPVNLEWEKPTTVAQGQSTGSGKVATATFIGDGDAVTGRFKDGSNITCRLDSINAPEVGHPAYTTKGGKAFKASPDQAFGKESQKNLENMILNKEVTITVTQSKGDRKYCQVSFQGNDVALKQVEDGFAWVYDKYISPELRNRFKSAETTAKSTRKGLWKDLNPENPETFAHRQQQ